MKKIGRLILGIVATFTISMPWIILYHAFVINGVDLNITSEFICFLIFIIWILFESWHISGMAFDFKGGTFE